MRGKRHTRVGPDQPDGLELEYLPDIESYLFSDTGGDEWLTTDATVHLEDWR